MNDAQTETIRAHVARITSDALFAGAERLCRFLRFTVDCALTGREDQVKEYVIGREVFDRGDDYDPRIDPIVRVEARRLRSRLAEYYAGPGADDPLRIEYPKGGYVPLIRSAQVPRPGAARMQRAWRIVVPTALVLTAAIAAFIAGHPPSSPVLAPIPTTWIEPNDGSLDAIDVVLAEDVDAELANQPGLHVVAWPEIVRKRNWRLLPLRDFASELAADSLVLILVRHQGSSDLVRVFLVDEPSGQKRLALSYVRPQLSAPSQQNAVAARIALDLPGAR